MKLNQIIIENKTTNEGPLDFLTKSGRAQMSANKSGKKTVQNTADNLMRQFSEYLGVQGKRRGQADTDDVIQFLQSKNVNVSDIDPTDAMNPARLKNIFQVKARNAVLAKRGVNPAPSGGSATPPAPSGSPAPSGGSATPPTPTSNAGSKYKQTLNTAKALSAKEKRRLITQLQKTLPGTP